jgi:uncharacterized protein
MLVVSIHDVAPSSLDDVRWLLSRLDELGVRPRVLKAIPAPGGQEIEPDSEVVDLLRAEQEAGSEIVVHGYTHRTAGPFGGSYWDTTRARLFAPDDAEFLSLEPGEAERRLARGRELLTQAGLAADGFCAPGWLAARWVDEAAARAGFTHVIGLLRIADFTRQRRRTVPAFGYMGADRTQERLVGVGGDTSVGLHRFLRDQFPHLRAFLHPAGARTSEDCARTLERIAALAASEPVGTYRVLLDSWGAAA